MRCTYERTIYDDDSSGYRIIAFSTQDESVPAAARNKSSVGAIQFVATGYRLPTTKAIDVELDGRWENSKYGLQYVVESCIEIIPHTKQGIIGYLSSGLIKGIGDKTAQMIVSHFGLDTLEILEQHPERLLEIKGITERKLPKIIASYQEHIALRDIIAFLAPFGITPKATMKIHQAFGAETMEILKKRPFELCTIRGFGFKTVDAIARKTACSFNDPMRIRGAILFILEEAELSGHLYLHKLELRDRAYHLLNAGFTQEVVSKKEINASLYQLVLSRDLSAVDGNVYKTYNYQAEYVTANNIFRLLKQPAKAIDIEDALSEVQKELNLTLASKQADAVRNCFCHPISIITGGPGTGKTTVLKAILRVYQKVVGGNILLMAPTGRAARRMAESTGYPEASTLHSVLGLVSEDEDNPMNDSEPLYADCVIVDEMSMVDMRLAKELFDRLLPNTKVILVGDAEQLPSVGPGNVFRELIGCGEIPVTVLDVVYRQKGTSRIALNAKLIHEGNHKLLYGDDFQFIPCDSAADAAEIVEQTYLSEVLKEGLENVQILTPFRSRGDVSVKALNQSIQNLVNPRSQSNEMKVGSQVFRVGDRVLQTRNKDEISNGDVGRITSIQKDGEDGELMADILFSDQRKISYAKEDMDIIEHAYAMSIHKSQGSEYKTVILPLLTSHAIMLRRNLLYTAITRAKSKIIVIGQKKALFIAIHRNDIDQRNTALAEHICKACQTGRNEKTSIPAAK